MKKSVFRNDKVVLLKEYNELKQVGNTYEVGGITESAIVLREVKTKTAVAAVAIEEFDNYFIKVENINNKFTPWTKFVDPTGDLIGFYRTNHKRVQVKLPVKYDNGYIRAEASCNDGDEFSLYFGIQLAYARATDKFYRLTYLEKCAVIDNKYQQNKRFIKSMLA